MKGKLLNEILALTTLTYKEVCLLRQEVQTLRTEVRTMDANVRAALDTVHGKLDELTTDMTTELDEIKTIVTGIQNNPAATQEIIDELGTVAGRIDTLRTSLQGMSDAVAPAAPPSE